MDMLPDGIVVRKSTLSKASPEFSQAIVTYCYELININPAERWDHIERELLNLCGYKVEKIGTSEPKTVRLSLKRTLQRIYETN